MLAATEEVAFTAKVEKAEDQLDISSWMREYLAFHGRCSAETKAEVRRHGTQAKQ